MSFLEDLEWKNKYFKFLAEASIVAAIDKEKYVCWVSSFSVAFEFGLFSGPKDLISGLEALE